MNFDFASFVIGVIAGALAGIFLPILIGSLWED